MSTIFALALIPLALSAGVAIDYLRMIETRGELQTAVDAAALAGASFDEGTDAQRTAAATKAFLANAPSGMPVSAPGISFASSKITVTATATLDPAIMNIAGFEPRDIPANATAIYSSGAPICLLALEPSDKEAVYINSNSQIAAPDCQVHINSSSSQALYGNSNGDIVAAKTCVKGGTYLNSGSTVTPAAQTCPVVADPLAALPVPAAASGACNFTDLTVKGKTTLSPGVYCGKLELNAGANVTFLPGIYIKKNGEFIINSGSDATGTGVMFYLTGNNNSRLNVNSGSHIDFKAPTTGTYAGIVFFQQRNISGADFSILNSDSTSKIEGVVYLPSTALKLNSSGSLSADTPWTIIVVDKLELNSHSTLNLNADYGASSVPVPAGLGGGGSSIVRLTE